MAVDVWVLLGCHWCQGCPVKRPVAVERNPMTSKIIARETLCEGRGVPWSESCPAEVA